MPSQKEEKIVPFSQQQVFNLVADVDKYEDFLPWCNSSKVIRGMILNDRMVINCGSEILTYGDKVYICTS